MSKIGNSLGLLMGDTFIDKMTDGFVTRKNYILFSLTNAEFNNENKIIGLGVLGNIFISDKIDDIFKTPKEKEEEEKEETKAEMTDSSNPNNKFEFTKKMLIRKYYFEDDNEMRDYITDDEDDRSTAIITDVNKDFSGMKIKFIKANDYLKQTFERNLNGEEWDVSFDAVEFDGNSEMCKECANDFKKLIVKGRKIKFAMAEAICGGSACNGIWTLIYVNIDEK